MPITSSTYVVDSHAQRDGSRWVRERHEEDTGFVHEPLYQAVPGTDYEAVMLARAASIDEARELTLAVEQERTEAEGKVMAVLEEAIRGGKVSEEELGLFGISVVAKGE